jgi:hypothetical protein
MSQIKQLDEILAGISHTLGWKSILFYDERGNLQGVCLGTAEKLQQITGLTWEAPKPALRVVEETPK